MYIHSLTASTQDCAGGSKRGTLKITRNRKKQKGSKRETLKITRNRLDWKGRNKRCLCSPTI